ncbi:MAG: efflux RND transporter periplasmic adaptor subunit [Alphaproteobacteria bacterium]
MSLHSFSKGLLSRRYFWVGLLIIIAVGAALFGFIHQSSHNPPTGTRTATVENGSITDVVTAQGKLEPRKFVDVGLQVSGQIKKLHVDVGNIVQKGQLLAEIDSRIYQSKVEEDTAQLKSLKAQAEAQAASLELTRRQYQRNLAIFQQHAISKDTLDQAETALKEAQAKLKSLKAQAEQAASQLAADKTNLDFARIYAPMDGVVASLPVREGQTINSVQSAPTLMQLANLDVMTVRAQVAEADISHIQLNMPAYFTTLGDMERKWQGRVRLIQPTPEVINDVVLYNVLIDVENPEHLLMNGMSTQLFFQLGKVENVPILPLEALGRRLAKEDSDQGKAYQIQLYINKKTEARTIFTGLSNRTHAQITQGLTVGDVVQIPARNNKTNSSTKTGGMPPAGMGGPRL